MQHFVLDLMAHYSAGYSLPLCTFSICATEDFFVSVVTVAKHVMAIEIRNCYAVWNKQRFLFNCFFPPNRCQQLLSLLSEIFRFMTLIYFVQCLLQCSDAIQSSQIFFSDAENT